MFISMAICGCIANAQDMPMQHSMHDSMPGMAMDSSMYLMSQGSGTSMAPESWKMPMFMTSAGSWHLMFMGQAFVVETQQSGPRGGDKLYSANWGMAEASHHLGGGTFMIQAMLSLDPATISGRSYPLLFQTGETAYGRPLVDAQHPHDFIMGLGFHYAHPLGESTTVHFYYAPVGDPALGPEAFPHRPSASELPQAPLGHHWQDSTHIADNVATVALKRAWLRLEASGFYGTEPDENRWNIDWGAMNSYSGRVSVFPSKNWMAQVSAGRIERPERQSPGDVVRSTASLHYVRPGSWAASLIWGRNHNTFTHRNLNSYLVEAVRPVGKRNFITGRAEVLDKDELLAGPEGSVYRIGAFTAGYTRDIAVSKHFETGLGGNVSAYAIPQSLTPYYGSHPMGVNVYLRTRLK